MESAGEVAGEEAAKTAVEAIIRFRFKDPGGDTEERIREAIALWRKQPHFPQRLPRRGPN